MNNDNTISIQEVRKNPVGFLRQLNKGKKITVIYHSKPYATVISADTISSEQLKSSKALLKYANQARDSAKVTLDTTKTYKQLYSEDMSKKYGISWSKHTFRAYS